VFDEDVTDLPIQANQNLNDQPLATRMRPTGIEEFVGQTHLLGDDKPLKQLYDSGALANVLLWGPPGCGKTTLAHLLSQRMGAKLHVLSAVDSGTKLVRSVVQEARERSLQGKRTVLFLDEVHRFNKAQQDLFLPSLEEGSMSFIGATTENPAFSVNNALLSRVQVFALKALETEALVPVIDRALSDEVRGLGQLKLTLESQAQQLLIDASGGDVRRLLNWLGHCAAAVSALGHCAITASDVKTLLADQIGVEFDRQGDHFYDQISALHKSVRGSSADAALYWLARMLAGGCDPLYIARRFVRMASEDIGNADPEALQVTLNCWEAQLRLGQPEGELALAQAAVYLAMAPKSDGVYRAFKAAKASARSTGYESVPLHLRNAPAKLLAELGHGADYRYAHDYPNAFVPGECYFPEGVKERRFYEPVARGFERQLQKRQQWFDESNANSDWQRYQDESGSKS